MAFYIRLRKFFKQNDPQRLYLVKKIVVSFREDENIIMDRLEQIYKDGGPSTLKSTGFPRKSFSYNDSSTNYSTQSNTDNTSLSNDGEEKNVVHGNEEPSSENINTPRPPKKSKKKLIILILLAVVLAAGGYYGYDYFMKDTPKTEESDEDNGDEGAATVEEPENSVPEEEKIEDPQPIAISDTITDSIQTPPDSLAVNLNVESTESTDSDEESDNE